MHSTYENRTLSLTVSANQPLSSEINSTQTDFLKLAFAVNGNDPNSKAMSLEYIIRLSEEEYQYVVNKFNCAERARVASNHKIAASKGLVSSGGRKQIVLIADGTLPTGTPIPGLRPLVKTLPISPVAPVVHVLPLPVVPVAVAPLPVVAPVPVPVLPPPLVVRPPVPAPIIPPAVAAPAYVPPPVFVPPVIPPNLVPPVLPPTIVPEQVVQPPVAPVVVQPPVAPVVVTPPVLQPAPVVQPPAPTAPPAAPLGLGHTDPDYVQLLKVILTDPSDPALKRFLNAYQLFKQAGL